MNEQTKTKYENFFTPLTNDAPYVKIAAEGEAGAGKSFTLAGFAEGIYQRIQSTKPIVVFDTERSSKFLRPRFAKTGIEVIVKESRTLADLIKTIQFCDEGNADILIIDSITHVWQKFMEDYMSSKKRTRMEFQDWGVVKPMWQKEFSYRFVLAHCHIMFTGRAGDVWEYQMIEGKKTLVKTGVKMKVEGETAYEPDILLLMERYEKILEENKEIWREATILKDRADIIDGKTFRNPTYKDIEPVVEYVLADVTAQRETISHPNSDMFTDESGNQEFRKQKDILIEHIDNLLDTVAAGTTKESKVLRLALKDYAFAGKTSSLEIAELNPDELEYAKGEIKKYVVLIESIQKGENVIYGNTKAIEAARNKYLNGEQNLGKPNLDTLQSYLNHLAEKKKNTGNQGGLPEGLPIKSDEIPD